MNPSQRKNKIAVFFIALAIATLAVISVYVFDGALRDFLGHYMVSNETHATILDITKLVLWGFLAIVVIRGLNSIIFGFFFRLRKGYEAPNLIRNIFSIIAYVIVFTILSKIFIKGVDLTTVLATSTAFGLIIGLALQETLGNLFAGASLHADKPFQVGDVITVSQHTGVVESVTWRAVKIRTFTNHIVLISNSNASKEYIQVFPRDNLNARLVFFNTVYSNVPARTIHVVREAVRDVPNVSPQMTPIVRIKNLGDNGVDYEVKYWLEDYARYNDTDALIRQRIWYAFQREGLGLDFAFPTRTVLMQQVEQNDQPADGHAVIDRLSAVDIFRPLTDAETAALAEATVCHGFAPGELVIRAGTKGSSMFIVHRGRVDVQIADNGRPRTVATLKEGDFFGEMALFTGEPRTANVVAQEETEVLEIGHQAVKRLFDTNPALVESLSRTIAERRAGLKAKQTDNEMIKKESAGVLASIKSFFGIS
ncbi:MAG TPA: cyclic nucleotide-binding domain-containing protein [Pyrinomonadaceae bacterium]|nr:cyclic nucleotide-binding domain-containing protein [Pyrinomonadaceae bacterium]